MSHLKTFACIAVALAMFAQAVVAQSNAPSVPQSLPVAPTSPLTPVSCDPGQFFLSQEHFKAEEVGGYRNSYFYGSQGWSLYTVSIHRAVRDIHMGGQSPCVIEANAHICFVKAGGEHYPLRLLSTPMKTHHIHENIDACFRPATAAPRPHTAHTAVATVTNRCWLGDGSVRTVGQGNIIGLWRGRNAPAAKLVDGVMMYACLVRASVPAQASYHYNGDGSAECGTGKVFQNTSFNLGNPQRVTGGWCGSPEQDDDQSNDPANPGTPPTTTPPSNGTGPVNPGTPVNSGTPPANNNGGGPKAPGT